MRSSLLNTLQFSLGDFLYLFLFLLFLTILIRFIYFAITYRTNKQDFWTELLRFALFPAVIYFFFLLFWGGNYSKKPVAASWQTNELRMNKERLIRLNHFLIDKLNELVDQNEVIPAESLRTINKKANRYFHQTYGARLPALKVKVTSLGYFLNYFGIHGYYNPLSGEAQFNKFIPPFMHPFVMTHEMAHQIGVAREGDANLIAYVLGVSSGDPAFEYSSYFNLLLYANADLGEKDKELATSLLSELNATTIADLDELRKMNRRYRSSLRRFSNLLYEEYLLLHGQEKGLDSYNEVTKTVYIWEIERSRKPAIQLRP